MENAGLDSVLDRQYLFLMRNHVSLQMNRVLHLRVILPHEEQVVDELVHLYINIPCGKIFVIDVQPPVLIDISVDVVFLFRVCTTTLQACGRLVLDKRFIIFRSLILRNGQGTNVIAYARPP